MGRVKVLRGFAFADLEHGLYNTRIHTTRAATWDRDGKGRKITAEGFVGAERLDITLSGRFTVDFSGDTTGPVTRVVARDQAGHIVYVVDQIRIPYPTYYWSAQLGGITGQMAQGGLTARFSTADDSFFGTDADDTVNAGGGNDAFALGDGNDRGDGGAGNDVIEAGDGRDLVKGGRGNDTLGGGGGTDRVLGQGGADFLNGGDGADTLLGGAGDDEIHGAAGNDTIDGGADDDIINGGAGHDAMTGGDGADTFVFAAASEIGTLPGARDVIADFAQGQDVIDLSAIDADAAQAEDQAFSFIGAAAFSGTAGELRVASFARKTLVMGDTDGDGTADFVLELTGALALAETDFVL